MQWELGDAAVGNLVLQGDDFYISYVNLQVKDIYEIKETALCKDDNFYILKGDHRAEYSKIITKGFEACLDYYHNPEEEKHNDA